MLDEHASVVLTLDLPAHSLQAGDVGIVVHVHQGQAAYEVEFLSLDGTTLSLQTLLPHQLRAATPQDIPHVRQTAPA